MTISILYNTIDCLLRENKIHIDDSINRAGFILTLAYTINSLRGTDYRAEPIININKFVYVNTNLNNDEINCLFDYVYNKVEIA